MQAGHPEHRLAPFDPLYAPVVAGWVQDSSELFWLAPSTSPPLTAAKIIEWAGEGVRPFLLWRTDHTLPVGYGELNDMPQRMGHFWLGHLLVCPQWRGRGVGVELVHRLLCEAFDVLEARTVSLVVFPDNVPAIRCYRRAGLVHVGQQWRYFQATRRKHRMLLMGITRSRFYAWQREPAPLAGPSQPRHRPAGPQ